MNLAERLVQLDRECEKRILVVGDAMTDVYFQGRVEQCQEGCPKFVEEGRVVVPGGAANAARSLQRWNCRAICVYPHTRGPRKERFMVGDQCVFRHDDDRCLMDFDLVRKEILNAVTDWKTHAVLISDYDKGLLTPDFIHTVIEACKQRQIPCVADVKRNPSLYKGALVKCNLTYYTNHCNEFLDSEQVVVTRGAASTVVAPCPLWQTPELPPVNCLNHVGAGDCFAAHLTLALAHKFSLKEAAAIAHSAGRVYVQHRHNEPPHPSEVVRDMCEV